MSHTVQLERPCKGVVSIAVPTPFSIGDVNVYLLEGQTLTLVDTGPNTETAWNALVKGIEAAGYRLTDLEEIVITHYHEDHSGLAYRLQKETGAAILSHPDTAVWLNGDSAFDERRKLFYADLYRRGGLRQERIEKIMASHETLRRFGHPCGVNGFLADGTCLESHPEWQIVYTPGHSQTHLSLYRASDQTMLLADHLIAHVSSNAFLEPTVRPEEVRVRPLIRYRQELQRLKQLPIRLGLSGHGEPIADHVALIEKRFESQKRRAGNILEILAEGERTAADIALRLFPRHQDQLPLIMSETIGHLEWLEEEGRIQKTSRNGIDWYLV